MAKRRSSYLIASLGGIFIVGLMPAGIDFAQQQRALPSGADRRESVVLDSLGDLQSRIEDLKSAVSEMGVEVARSRREALGLREELQATRTQVESLQHQLAELRAQNVTASKLVPAEAAKADDAPILSKAPVDDRLAKLEEEQQLLNSKLDDQYQTKVSSASKHRVRVSGIALLNLFGTRGSVDNLDLPGLARPASFLGAGTSLAATVRQSQLGLEVFGPEVGGAKSRGELQFDFFGGFPNTLDGVTVGMARLRIATFRLDWPHTSIVAGQDTPFFSPLSPTSLASLGFPALAYSGNLWTWTPQVRIENRLDVAHGSSILIQGGLLDALSGEPPYDQFYRTPQAGERGRNPAYASRIAWTRPGWGGPFTFGAGGYYARQNWGLGRMVDAWAGTADWSFPLGERVSLSGEFYRGRALGGLGGGVGRSVVFSGAITNPNSQVLGLNTAGGWGQLKFRPTEKLEFNGIAGGDFSLTSDLRRFPSAQSYIDVTVGRNRTTALNAIYHARSNVLFSAEYRHIRTDEIYATSHTADHLNLGVGILF